MIPAGEGTFRGLISEATVESRPRVIRIDGKRAAYYPEDMALFALGDGERAPIRSVPEPRPPDLPEKIGFRGLIVFPTHACNLACRYCYIGVQGRRGVCLPDSRPADLMTDRTVCRAMDLLWRSKRIMVSFFGGEPLLAWGKIKWIVERAEAMARERGARPKLHVTTNATLVTSERAAYLAEHKFSVIASLDGPRDLHDAERVGIEGTGTYDDALRGITVLRTHIKERGAARTDTVSRRRTSSAAWSTSTPSATTVSRIWWPLSQPRIARGRAADRSAGTTVARCLRTSTPEWSGR